ncbi:MAG: hypothetical protein HKN68_13575 [Saprospiraceae bacterium]|nr:hypothetical protein [Saprospiraceae bacterium]
MILSKKLKIGRMVVLVLIIMSMISCKQKVDDSAAANVKVEPMLPVMPLQQQSYLFDNVQLIDYIFHDLPFSLSQSERPSIQTKIAGIGREPVMNNNCKSIARVFYQVEGEIIIEADLFFAPPDCHYYLFYEEGKAVYANQMAPSSIQFYSQFLNQMNVTQ